MNRILTDAISDLLFVTEPSGVSNLEREGIPADKITFAGNVMIDTLVRELPAAKRVDIHKILGIESEKYGLVTLHRPGNVDDVTKLRAITEFLLSASSLVKMIFPVHPRTRARLEQAGLLSRIQCDRILILEPLGYHENLALMSAATLVLTDSGGIQEETSYLRIPCLTLRPNTERPITVTHGTNTIIGDDLSKANVLAAEILNGRYKQPRDIPLWDGHASDRIASTLVSHWGQ